MNDKERGARFSFVAEMENSPDNKKANSYETLVTNSFAGFHDLGCYISIKLHFLCSHFNTFPKNLEAVSDEQGERFHQGVKTLEERYQGRLDKHDS